MVEHKQEYAKLITNGGNGAHAQEAVYAVLAKLSHRHAEIAEHNQEHAKLITNGGNGAHAQAKVNAVPAK